MINKLRLLKRNLFLKKVRSAVRPSASSHELGVLEFTPAWNRDRLSSKPEIRSGLLNFYIKSNLYCAAYDKSTSSPADHTACSDDDES